MFMAVALYGTYFFVVFLALNIRNSDPLEVLEVLPFFLVASRNRPNYFEIALFSKKSSFFAIAIEFTSQEIIKIKSHENICKF